MLKNKKNINIFSKPLTLEACYWAGFIAADGNIAKCNNRISICSSIKDAKHLIKFSKFIYYNKNKVQFFSSKSSPSGVNSWICVCNKKLKEDLKNNFNIVTAKSLTLKPPKNLTRNQSLAYIKGYVDGDGHFRIDNRGQFVSDIVGSKSFLIWIKKQINTKTKSKIYKDGNIYRIKLFCSPAKVLYNNLKIIKTPELKRKWKWNLWRIK